MRNDMRHVERRERDARIKPKTLSRRGSQFSQKSECLIPKFDDRASPRMPVLVESFAREFPTQDSHLAHETLKHAFHLQEATVAVTRNDKMRLFDRQIAFAWHIRISQLKKKRRGTEALICFDVGKNTRHERNAQILLIHGQRVRKRQRVLRSVAPVRE